MRSKFLLLKQKLAFLGLGFVLLLAVAACGRQEKDFVGSTTPQPSSKEVLGGQAGTFIKNWREKNQISQNNSIPIDDINVQILGSDPESPASVFQRIQLTALALFKSYQASVKSSVKDFDKQGELEIDAVDFCPLLEAIYKSKTQTPFDGSDRMIAEALFLKDAKCGEGILSNVTISGKSGKYLVDFELNDDLDVESFRSTYRANRGHLQFNLYEDTKPALALGLIRELNGNSSFKKELEKLFVRYPIGFDIAAALSAVMDAYKNDADPNQALRVLGNYKIFLSVPVASLNNLSFKKSGSYRSWGSAGSEFLMHAPPMAQKTREMGFGKSVFSVRMLEEAYRSGVELSVGEARLLTDIKLNDTWKNVAEATLRSVSQTIENHFDAISRTGIGIMYGPRSRYASLTDSEKLKFIEQNKKFAAKIIEPVETSCIGFVQSQLRIGYQEAGLGDRFKEIDKVIYGNSGQGTYLINELKKDGWKTIYWNPDKRDPTERVVKPSISNDHHIWTWAMLRDGHKYMQDVMSYGKVFPGIAVDFMALDFRPTNPKKTKLNEVAFKKLQELPFFVGVANGGYHVYMGSHGMIIESHSTRNPTDATNIELRPFNQFGMLKNEGYLSGVIAVPPGPWASGLTKKLLE